MIPMILKRLLFISAIAVSPLAFVRGADLSPNGGRTVIVAPSKIEITAKPGETIRREFVVANQSADNLNLALRFENLAAPENPLDGVSLAEDKTPIFPLTPYLSAGVRSFTLPPNSRVIIPIVIDLPKKITPGGYYGAAVLSITSIGNGVTGTHLVTRLTPLLFLRVAGPTVETGALIDFNLIGSHFRFSAAPPTFYLTYQNTGTVYLNPYGLIKIKNQITGRKINLPIDPWFVLPGTTRIREVETSRTLASGWYQVKLLLNRGYGSSTDQRVANFIIVTPVVLVLVGLVVLTGLFIIIRRLIMMKRSGIIPLILLMVALAGSTRGAWAAVASSTNYRLQADSLNFGGRLSASANYSLEDIAGEIGTGNATSTSYASLAGFQQMLSSIIAITVPTDATLSAIAGTGASDGSVAWTVTTDDPAGYTLSIKASSNPALASGGNSFSDYAPSGAVPDYDWTVAASASAFGFSPEGADIASRYLNSGSTCGAGATDTADRCWDGFSTTDRTIAQSSTSNTPSGVATTVKLKAEVGSSKTQTVGSYAAALTVTATPR